MEWKWSKANEKDIAKFVAKDAHQLLKLHKSSYDLVQNREGRKQLVKLIYEALINKNINYNGPKYHPDDVIQPIRKPGEVLLCPNTGTCLDLALLFCGICLGYDLLPLLIIIEGHALIAVSLNYQLSEWDRNDEGSIFHTLELFAGEKN